MVALVRWECGWESTVTPSQREKTLRCVCGVCVCVCARRGVRGVGVGREKRECCDACAWGSKSRSVRPRSPCALLLARDQIAHSRSSKGDSHARGDRRSRQFCVEVCVACLVSVARPWFWSPPPVHFNITRQWLVDPLSPPRWYSIRTYCGGISLRRSQIGPPAQNKSGSGLFGTHSGHMQSFRT